MYPLPLDMAQIVSDSDRATRSIAATIGYTARLSIMTALNFIRLLFLISPFLLSIPQIANAKEISAFAAVDESIFDTLPLGEARSAGSRRFGPFTIVDSTEARLDGATDEMTPDQFSEMIREFPDLRRITMIDCPGTENDDANLEVARMIRKAGISTHVPADGSVRSGGVELFLAGIKRSYEKGAQFGVHSWMDEDGLQASDVPADDPINVAYINYYREVGLPPAVAKAFYDFTNQTAFNSIHYMSDQELARFHIVN
jgi:hypothetical protein